VTTPAELELSLAAAIEAIQERGWDLRLTSNTPRSGEWHAIVWTAAHKVSSHRASHNGYGASPAEALLAAYLKAVKNPIEGG